MREFIDLDFIQKELTQNPEKAREKVRTRITEITNEIFKLFHERQELMELIAKSKENNSPILHLGREYELLSDYKEKAIEM